MNNRRIKYPIGIQSFSELINGGYMYVDKTKYIHELIESGKYYFLSRPRRFGKSLLLSTIQACFEGRRDLFNGLAIERLRSNWNSHPVILLSLATYEGSLENLPAILDKNFSELEEKYGVSHESQDFSMRFRNIIRNAKEKTGKNVVILIDEYDAPVVAHMENTEVQTKMRGLLKSIYTNIKDLDEYIAFAMLTGVSRFSKMTIFSGLNNLNDISLDKKYSEICGITDRELTTYFNDGIESLADVLDTDVNGALNALKANYDGYHFAQQSADIYNPFSLLLALSKSEIRPYWFQSGSPSFLIHQLHQEKVALSEIFNDQTDITSLEDINTFDTSPTALLFQTGYLTIKDYDPEFEVYKLGIPNREVKKGLFTELLAYNSDLETKNLNKYLLEIRRMFDTGNPEKGLDIIKSFFAGIPYFLSNNMPEIYYQNNLYLLFCLIGLDAKVEWSTSDGRIDILLITKKFVYIFELKLDGSAESAINQINSKDYSLPWKYDGRKIFKIGVNYSKQTRNISDWIIIEE